MIIREENWYVNHVLSTCFQIKDGFQRFLRCLVADGNSSRAPFQSSRRWVDVWRWGRRVHHEKKLISEATGAKRAPFKQTIEVSGCLPMEVMNNFCYGQCNSLYIPDHESAKPLFESCTSCLPQRTYTKTVTLRCPSLPVKFRKHKYTYSKKCRCTSVKKWTSRKQYEARGDESWRSCSRFIWWQLRKLR